MIKKSRKIKPPEEAILGSEPKKAISKARADKVFGVGECNEKKVRLPLKIYIVNYIQLQIQMKVFTLLLKKRVQKIDLVPI